MVFIGSEESNEGIVFSGGGKSKFSAGRGTTSHPPSVGKILLSLT